MVKRPPLRHIALAPAPPLDTHLHGGQAPVLAVVVGAARDAGAGLGLVLGEDGEDAEDDGDARVELHPHEAVRDRVGDVLEVHGLALDEDADGDEGVEGGVEGLRAAGRRRAEGGQVRGAAAQEVAGAGAAGGGGLDLRAGEHAVWRGKEGGLPFSLFFSWPWVILSTPAGGGGGG